jgi:K+-transporting ATPase A subunit
MLHQTIMMLSNFNIPLESTCPRILETEPRDVQVQIISEALFKIILMSEQSEMNLGWKTFNTVLLIVNWNKSECSYEIIMSLKDINPLTPNDL